MKKSKKLMSVLLAGALSLSLIFTAACSKKSNNVDNNVLTIGEIQVSLQDMMYYIYAVEAEGNYYEQMYSSYGMGSYWDSSFEEGVTMRDQTKTFLIDSVVMYEILHDKAVKAGYELTDAEQLEASTNAATILENMSEEQIKLTGFTEELLTTVQGKLMLGEKYYNEVTEGLNLNEEEITNSINKADYNEFTTEYIYAPTKSYDAEGNVVDISAEDKAALLTKLEGFMTRVNKGETFTEISTSDTSVDSKTLVFIEGQEDVEPEYQEAAMKLSNDEIADGIIETEYGYYLIKMIDTDSTTQYDAAITSAIDTAKSEGFNTKYAEIQVDYPHVINEKVWGPLVMGTITVVPVEAQAE